MKKTYFTVGPTHLYPTVPKHLQEAIRADIGAISHRGKKVKEIIKDTSESLKKLLNIPNTHRIFFVSSSLESMERIIQNCVDTHSMHVTCGEFSKKFASIAQDLEKKTTLLPVNETSQPLDTIKVPKSVELICLTQNETSTGMWLDPKEIAKLKVKYPKLLIAVDIVSSVPYVTIDYKSVDVAFFSVQKGFGLPAGLGILIVGPKALKKAEALKKKKKSIGSYHSFLTLFEKEQEYQTPETPNVLFIYLLGKVCEDMRRYGIQKIRKETDEKARLVYAFFEKHKRFEPFLKHPQHRSKTTLVIDVKGKTEQLLSYLAEYGFIVSSGYGPYKKEHIRIANFPGQTLPIMKKMIRSIADYSGKHL